MRWSCVIFDLDGTILDSHAFTFAAFRHAVSPWGLVPGDAAIHAAFGPSERTILQGLVAPEHVDEAYERLQHWYRAEASRARLHAEIPTVLSALGRAGMARCLFTGRGGDSTQFLLESHGLSREFEAVVTGDSPCAPKPSREGIDRLLRSVGCSPRQAIVFGDSRLDLQAAAAAGVRAVGVSWFTPVSVSGIESATLSSPREILALLGLEVRPEGGATAGEPPGSPG